MHEQRPDLRFARACIFLALLFTLAFRVFAPAARGAAQAETVALELVQAVPSGTALDPARAHPEPRVGE